MAEGENRSALRVPINCKAKIRPQDSDISYYGVCLNLSVDGMQLETDYVPRFGEIFEVHLAPPPGGGFEPLMATVQVSRCTQLVPGKSYELGVKILTIER